MTARACTGCGRSFTPPARSGTAGGRPRTRCDECRSNHARLDGAKWRRLRAQVLAEEPVCGVPGCSRLSEEVDHIVPLQLRPDLGLERSNLRGLCKTHNARKGARVGRGGRVAPVDVEEAAGCECPDVTHGDRGCGTAATPGLRSCMPCRFFRCLDVPDAEADDEPSSRPSAGYGGRR